MGKGVGCIRGMADYVYVFRVSVEVNKPTYTCPEFEEM